MARLVKVHEAIDRGYYTIDGAPIIDHKYFLIDLDKAKSLLEADEEALYYTGHLIAGMLEGRTAFSTCYKYPFSDSDFEVDLIRVMDGMPEYHVDIEVYM